MLKNTFKKSLHFYFSLGIIVVSMSFFISFGQSVDLFKRDVSVKNSSFTPSFVFQKKSDTPIVSSNQKQNNNKRRNSHNKSRVNNFLKKKDVKIQPVNLFAGLIILANQQNTALSKNTYYFFNFISSIFRPPHF